MKSKLMAVFASILMAMGIVMLGSGVAQAAPARMWAASTPNSGCAVLDMKVGSDPAPWYTYRTGFICNSALIGEGITSQNSNYQDMEPVRLWVAPGQCLLFNINDGPFGNDPVCGLNGQWGWVNVHPGDGVTGSWRVGFHVYIP